jgi:hypothetical protein
MTLSPTSSPTAVSLNVAPELPIKGIPTLDTTHKALGSVDGRLGSSPQSTASSDYTERGVARFLRLL